MSQLSRRSIMGLAFTGALVLVSGPAFAGSYLNQAALMLDQAREEGDLLQPRTHDKELAFLIKGLAEARASVARKMLVPKAVGEAHPHLLLVLENSERAATAAHGGDFKTFMERLTVARNEAHIFETLIHDLGFQLPELSRKR